MTTNIFCIGGAAIDRKLKTIKPMQLATSNPISTSITFGGVAHNVARNLAQLTDNIYLQCIVGDDNEGQQLLAHLNKAEIDTKASLVKTNGKTASYYAILEPDGELAVALIDMEIYDDIDFELFTKTWDHWQAGDLVFLDTNLSLPLIEHAILESIRKELILCIDPVSALKATKLPSNLEGVYLIKPDRFEAEVLTGIQIHSINDCIAAGMNLIKRGVKNCVISLGKSGYVVVNDASQKHFPAIPIEVMHDVSGAGDAFIAGILFELKQGSAILRACEFGAAAAAYTLQSHQTVADKMTISQLNTLLSEQEREESVRHATVF